MVKTDIELLKQRAREQDSELKILRATIAKLQLPKNIPMPHSVVTEIITEIIIIDSSNQKHTFKNLRELVAWLASNTQTPEYPSRILQLRTVELHEHPVDNGNKRDGV